MTVRREFSHWRKSTRSNGQGGNCVEVGFTPDAELTGVRDTKQAHRPDRTTLTFRRTAWTRFLDAVKAGRV